MISAIVPFFLYPIRKGSAQLLAKVPAGMEHTRFHRVDRTLENDSNLAITEFVKVGEIHDCPVSRRKFYDRLHQQLTNSPSARGFIRSGVETGTAVGREVLHRFILLPQCPHRLPVCDGE